MTSLSLHSIASLSVLQLFAELCLLARWLSLAVVRVEFG